MHFQIFKLGVPGSTKKKIEIYKVIVLFLIQIVKMHATLGLHVLGFGIS